MKFDPAATQRGHGQQRALPAKVYRTYGSHSFLSSITSINVFEVGGSGSDNDGRDLPASSSIAKPSPGVMIYE